MEKRTVTLALVDPAGELLGAMPPVEVGSPWWQDVHEVADERWQVLRLLDGDRPGPPGGHVIYLAETTARPAGLRPIELDLAPHPKRAPYAEVGGPAASLAWASGAYATAHQRRTWNLSAIWRLDGSDGRPVAWLKQVPWFFAHEPDAIRLVDAVVPGLVPSLIEAGTEGRMLLAPIDGEDRHGAGADVCAAVAEAFHPVQAALAAGGLEGIPDGRIDAGRIARVAAPYLDRIAGLGKLLDSLPDRLASVAECGLPDTLMHGDLHPGNVRTDDAGRLTIMDWGDCAIGHPAFDILRLTGGLDDPGPLLGQWARRWESDFPGTDPRRAVELLRPVARLREALVYATFLDNIEPSEWPYHAADVPDNLAASIVEA